MKRSSVTPLLLFAVALTIPAPTRIAAAPPSDRVEAAADLVVRRLVDGVWLHTSFATFPNGVRHPSNGLIVREGNELVLVDTAWGDEPTHALVAWIDRELKLPIARTIVTHAHDDRMGGAGILARRNIPLLGHPLTGPLAERQGWPRPEPIAALGAVGGAESIGEVEVFYPGPAHTLDNIAVWLPRAGILFGGCAVKDARSSNLGNVADAVLAAWPDAIRRMQARYGAHAKIVVPGHGEPGGAELLAHTLELAVAHRE